MHPWHSRGIGQHEMPMRYGKLKPCKSCQASEQRPAARRAPTQAATRRNGLPVSATPRKVEPCTCTQLMSKGRMRDEGWIENIWWRKYMEGLEGLANSEVGVWWCLIAWLSWGSGRNVWQRAWQASEDATGLFDDTAWNPITSWRILQHTLPLPVFQDCTLFRPPNQGGSSSLHWNW